MRLQLVQILQRASLFKASALPALLMSTEIEVSILLDLIYHQKEMKPTKSRICYCCISVPENTSINRSTYHTLLASKLTKQKEHAKPHGCRKPFPMLRTLKMSCFSTMYSWIFLLTVAQALTFMSVYFTAVCYKRHLFRPAHVFVSN